MVIVVLLPLFGHRYLVTAVVFPLVGYRLFITAVWLPLFGCRSGVDTRSKGPLLHLESAAAAGSVNGVWPPPQSGRGSAPGSDTMNLEAPLLAPSAPPMLVASDSDDCFLDAINEVSLGQRLYFYYNYCHR